MKHYITKEEFVQLEEILMKAEIPYYVFFNSHACGDMKNVTYDKCIKIEPIVIQTKMEV